MQALSRTARNAALLLALLMTFFLVMSLQVNRGSTLAAARGAVTGVASPVQRIGAAVGDLITGTWGRYFGLVGADRENEHLRERVAELERLAASGAAAKRENRRLRELLVDRPDAAGEWTGARVVGRDFTQRYETVTIDRGSRDGVVRDAAIVGAGGALVGRVIEVNLWTSSVQLITDPLSGIGARLAESRATGLAAGNGPGPLQLNYISSRAMVAVGEAVVTSGEDGIYPPDLVLGTVAGIGIGPPVPGTPLVPLMRDATALFKLIDVVPAIDVLALENVLVRLPTTAPPTPANPEALDPEQSP
jgi:rod shape-determining protein MreC